MIGERKTKIEEDSAFWREPGLCLQSNSFVNMELSHLDSVCLSAKNSCLLVE